MAEGAGRLLRSGKPPAAPWLWTARGALLSRLFAEHHAEAPDFRSLL